MTMTATEAVRELLAGRLTATRPDGVVVGVVPDPGADTDEWGPPYLDPPFPARLLGGESVPVREGRITPFHPPAFDDSDLAPE